MKNRINKKKGFTMLVAIVVTSMLLIISFVVANIAYKQLILANSNQESQYAFYNADSGVECAVYWDFRNGVSAFATATTATILCNGQTINSMGGGGVGNATSTFTLNFGAPGKGCAVVQVGKHNNNLTIVDSRGYNNCTVGAARRLERAQKLTYTN